MVGAWGTVKSIRRVSTGKWTNLGVSEQEICAFVNVKEKKLGCEAEKIVENRLCKLRAYDTLVARDTACIVAVYIIRLVAPVVWQVFLVPATGQLREFESPHVLLVCIRKGFFLRTN